MGLVVHNCIPSTQEAGTEEFQVQSQLGLHSKTCLKNKNNK
jgi:hypothetical protein